MRIWGLLIFLLLTVAGVAQAQERAAYAPGKVVYDFSSADPAALGKLLDRANLLQSYYYHDPFEASIVIVVHEGAVPLFARRGPSVQAALMQRAEGLATGSIIEVRLCGASARMQGYRDGDFPAFVALVPMADAEIVRLQQAGYAYLN